MLRILLWLFILIPFGSSAQIDSILLLKKEMQYEAILQLYDRMMGKDTSQMLERLERLEAECREKGEPLLAQQFWSLQVRHRINRPSVPDSMRIKMALAAIEEARKKKWDVAEAEWVFMTGLYFFQQRRYGPAFEYFIRSYKLSKELGFAAHPNLAGTLVTTGLIHHSYGDYTTALEYFREIISLKDQWASPLSLTNVINTAGLCFQKLEQYDSAAYYFVMARDLALSALHDTSYAIIIDGNRAVAYRRMGQTEKAIPLLEQDFILSPHYNQIGSAVNAAIELASIYLEKKDIPVAQKYLEYAGKHINRHDLRPSQSYYENIYRIRRAQGHFAQALMYLDSSEVLIDTIAKVHDAAILAQAKQRVEVEQYLHELSVLESLRKRQILMRNGAVIITLLLGIAGLLWYHRRYIQRQKELEIAALNQQLAEEQLLSARNELQAFTKMLTEKNALLESVNEELSKVKEDDKMHPVIADLSTLMSRTILTEEDWQQFRILFEKVYPGFFFRMKEKFPDITPADVRLLSLTKLHLSPKEMAAMLGISYDGIKKSRRRLRERINLPEEGTLDEVVEAI